MTLTEPNSLWHLLGKDLTEAKIALNLEIKNTIEWKVRLGLG